MNDRNFLHGCYSPLQATDGDSYRNLPGVHVKLCERLASRCIHKELVQGFSYSDWCAFVVCLSFPGVIANIKDEVSRRPRQVLSKNIVPFVDWNFDTICFYAHYNCSEADSTFHRHLNKMRIMNNEQNTLAAVDVDINRGNSGRSTNQKL